MVDNPDFESICPAIKNLDRMRDVLKELNTHCLPRLMDKSLLKQANDVSLLGSKTVAYTYLMFMLREGLGNIESLKGRRAKVEDIKAGVMKKTGKPLALAYMTALADACK